MAMLRRFGFLILTNILVMGTIILVINLLGVGNYVSQSGLDYGSLAVFCLVWGMGGSFISLQMSRFMAKRMTGATVIDPNQPGQYQWLVQMIHDLSRRARLPAMPEVAVYSSNDVNAFATGPSKARSLVAVSTALLQQMDKAEIEGVMAHEVAHIQNGDMVSMTLIQGVVNAFSLFLSRVLSFAIASAMSSQRDNEERGDSSLNHGLHWILTTVFDIVFTILGSIAVNYYSRQREFRADNGSAKLSGTPTKMIAALQALQRVYERPSPELDDGQPALATMKISSRNGGSLVSLLFSTHPPLESRIKALQRGIS